MYDLFILNTVNYKTHTITIKLYGANESVAYSRGDIVITKPKANSNFALRIESSVVCQWTRGCSGSVDPFQFPPER